MMITWLILFCCAVSYINGTKTQTSITLSCAMFLLMSHSLFSSHISYFANVLQANVGGTILCSFHKHMFYFDG